MTATLTTAGELLGRVRERHPLVQCLTNTVVTNVTANTLLALQAAPAMVDIVGEAGPFARVADAVLVNLGTPDTEQRAAMREAVTAAGDAGTPWVLDPVAVGSLPVRTALAAELLGLRPTAIRGNASEILALAGAGAGGKGVDSTAEARAAALPAARLARDSGAVVAVSGPQDIISDGDRSVHVTGGSVLLTRVTGGGCALGAVVGAFLAVRDETSSLEAVAAAHLVYAVAAERAAARAGGPGSFAPAFLDALAEVGAEQLREHEPATIGPAPRESV